MIEDTRLKKQLGFIVEADKVKSILRRTSLFDGSRRENDAEHSWTVCLMASLLAENANFEVNVGRVMAMLLIHDVVEIDAGDTFLYAKERDNAHDAEEKAARRIFGLLPDDQSEYLFALWGEFEERKTNDAKFASVFDRLEPIMQNYLNEGAVWKEHGITKSMVVARNRHIADGSAEIWEFVARLLDECVERGFLVDR